MAGARRTNTNRRTSYSNYFDERYDSYRYRENYQVLPEEEIYEPEIAPVRQPKGKQKKQTVYIHDANKIKSLSFLSWLIIIAVFSGIIMCVSVNAASQKETNRLNQLQKDLKAVQDANTALSAQVYDGVDKVEVYNICTQRLGMVKPDESHTYYVTLPQQNYSVQYDATDPNLSTPVSFDFSKFLDIFK